MAGRRSKGQAKQGEAKTGRRRAILQAALESGRQEMLATVALVLLLALTGLGLYRLVMG